VTNWTFDEHARRRRGSVEKGERGMDQSAREAVVLEGYLQRRPTNKALVKRWQTRHVTLTRSSLTIRKKKDGNPSSLPPPTQHIIHNINIKM
jgi:hypothetical protein